MKHLGTLAGAAVTAVLVTALALNPASADEPGGDTPTAPETTQSETESTPSGVEATPVAPDPQPATEETPAEETPAEEAPETPEDADGTPTPTEATPPAEETPVVSEADSAPRAAEAVRSITVDDDATILISNQERPEATIVSIARTGCTITITVTAQVAGTYMLEVWDDEQFTTYEKTIEAGGTATFTHTITQAFGNQAPGLDFDLRHPRGSVIHRVAWDFNNSAEITAACATTPEPPTPQITVDDDATILDSDQVRPDASITSILREGCTISITVAAQVAGTYMLEVWDEEPFTTYEKTLEAGGTATFTYNITKAFDDQEPGLDFVLRHSDGDLVHYVDWDFDNSVAITAACAAAPQITVDDDATVLKSDQYLPDASITSILREGCTVTITVAAQVAGTYMLEVWDDGERLTTYNKYIEAGGTATFTHTITQAFGDWSPGLGFFVKTQDGGRVHDVDWDFENSAEITKGCVPAPTPPSRSGASKPPIGLAQTGSPITMVAAAAVLLASAGILIRRRTS